MKLLQKGYNEIQGLEIELRILEQTSAPPSRPRKFSVFLNDLFLKWQHIIYIYKTNETKICFYLHFFFGKSERWLLYILLW